MLNLLMVVLSVFFLLQVEQDAKLVQTEIALLPKLRGGAKSEKEKKAKKVKTHPSGHGANLPKSIDERAFEKAEKKVKIKVEKVQNSVSTRKIGKQEKEEEEESDASVALEKAGRDKGKQQKEEEEESDASVAPEKAGRDKGVTKQKREKSDKAAKVDKGAD